MESEEQRVKDIKTNNKEFLWYIKDRKDLWETQQVPWARYSIP